MSTRPEPFPTGLMPRQPGRGLLETWVVLFSGLLPLCAGCPATQSLPSQADIRQLTEPRTRCEYLIYVPSIYSDQQRWPLVVACHGTWPYDRADLQMREWAKFAEYEGIIVAAPHPHDNPPKTPPILLRPRRDVAPATDMGVQLTG